MIKAAASLERSAHRQVRPCRSGPLVRARPCARQAPFGSRPPGRRRRRRRCRRSSRIAARSMPSVARRVEQHARRRLAAVARRRSAPATTPSRVVRADPEGVERDALGLEQLEHPRLYGLELRDGDRALGGRRLVGDAHEQQARRRQPRAGRPPRRGSARLARARAATRAARSAGRRPAR